MYETVNPATKPFLFTFVKQVGSKRFAFGYSTTNFCSAVTSKIMLDIDFIAI